MIGSKCIVAARYNMLCDVYEQTTTRNPETRQQERVWNRIGTFECLARGVSSSGVEGVGSSERHKGSRDYEELEYVRFFMSDKVSKRSVITNVREKQTERLLWTGDNGDALIHEVIGSAPSISPFGKLQEYEVFTELKQDGSVNVHE